jgi:protein-tyrosine phosphatase
MSDWRPNFDWITDNLAVGGSFPARAATRLVGEHGIRAVIDLRSEEADDEALLRAHGIASLHLPTHDMCAIDRAHLDRGVEFAARHLDRSERVLVHCAHGIGRSALLALCILVDRDLAPLAALELLKDRRRRVCPTNEQLECWSAWLAAQRRRRPCDWEVPDLDDCKAIAHRDWPSR